MVFRYTRPSYKIRVMLCCVLAASVCWFSWFLTTIKKSDHIGIYGVDLIAYYTAARMVRTAELSTLYAQTESGLILRAGRFYEAAREAAPAVVPTRYVYMPIFITPFLLVSHYSFPGVAMGWLLLNLCVIIAVIAVQYDLTRPRAYRGWWLAVVVAINLFSFPLFYGLKLGQTSIMIYGIICLVYWLVQKKEHVTAGFLLGVVVALKFSPILFCLHFLLRKKNQVVLWCILTAGLLMACSVFFYGVPLHQAYMDVLSGVMGKSTGGWSNQSIDAFLLRLTGSGDVLGYSMVSASGTVFAGKCLGLLGLVILLLLFPGTRQAEDHAFSLTVLAYLVLPHISWQHYFCLAVLPALFLLRLFASEKPAMPAAVFVPALTACIMVLLPPYAVAAIIARGQGIISTACVSLPFMGACIMIGLFIVLLIKQRKDMSAHRHRGPH